MIFVLIWVGESIVLILLEVFMSTYVDVEQTPNPNALKFVLKQQVITKGNYTFTSLEESKDSPLAEAIFQTSKAIRELYFFDNFITVTQDGSELWYNLQEKIARAIKEKFPAHNPNFGHDHMQEASFDNTESKDPELQKINELLDLRVRPALQQDGGDLRILSYKENTLKVFYQGACGSCPSAAMGTLNAIQNLLQSEVNPNITVVMG